MLAHALSSCLTFASQTSISRPPSQAKHLFREALPASKRNLSRLWASWRLQSLWKLSFFSLSLSLRLSSHHRWKSRLFFCYFARTILPPLPLSLLCEKEGRLDLPASSSSVRLPMSKGISPGWPNFLTTKRGTRQKRERERKFNLWVSLSLSLFPLPLGWGQEWKKKKCISMLREGGRKALEGFSFFSLTFLEIGWVDPRPQFMYHSSGHLQENKQYKYVEAVRIPTYATKSSEFTVAEIYCARSTVPDQTYPLSLAHIWHNI